MTDAADWQARVGEVWASEWRRTERAFAGIGAALDRAIVAVAPERGRALDIGTGAGSTALALAGRHTDLEVVGVDLAPDLVALARTRADRHNCRFVAGDAQWVAATLAPLDLLVSRHGVMFFADPAAAFSALRAAATPGAPLVFSCFRDRHRNAWARTIDDALQVQPPAPTGYAPGPFAFADRAFVGELLARAGWMRPVAVPIACRYRIGAGDDPVADALAFLRRIGPAAGVLAAASAAERPAMLERLAAMLAARLQDGAIDFAAEIWIWTATAGGPP